MQNNHPSYDRDVYVAWVKSWKARYAGLTAEIRALNRFLTDSHPVTMYETNGFKLYLDAFSGMQSRKMALRVDARDMMSERMVRKMESKKKREKRLQQA